MTTADEILKTRDGAALPAPGAGARERRRSLRKSLKLKGPSEGGVWRTAPFAEARR
jgi:hypothetical protein